MKIPIMNAVLTEQFSGAFSQSDCPQGHRVEVTAWDTMLLGGPCTSGLANPPLHHPCTTVHMGREPTLLSQRKKQPSAASFAV